MSVNDDSVLEQLIETVNDLFLKSFIIPNVGKIDDKLARICANVLFDQKPASVSCWAVASDIHVTYLRRKWELWTRTKPKEALFLITIFRAAFRYYKLNKDENSCNDQQMENVEKMQMNFMCNRSRYMQIIFRKEIKESQEMDNLCFWKKMDVFRIDEVVH